MLAATLLVSTALFAPLDMERMAPQGFGAPAGSPRGTPQPGGGTPEPATLLLLAGGAVGYGAYRFKQARRASHGETTSRGPGSQEQQDK